MNLSVSIMVGLGISPENVIRRKMMRLGIKIENIQDILQNENPNFDSKDLRLFVSNPALSAENNDVNAWFVDSRSLDSHEM
jgi:hypothetical protein